MSVAARVAIWQLVPLGGGVVEIDYEMDRSQEFTAQRRGSGFTVAKRETTLTAQRRDTTLTAQRDRGRP